MKTTVNIFIVLALLIFSGSLQAAELVNINSASSAELDTLPEIGPALAQRIIDYRNGPNGPYETKEEIMNVSGIGPATFDAIKDLITVESVSAPQNSDTTEQDTDDTVAPESQKSSSSNPVPLKQVQIKIDGAVVAQAPARFVAQASDEKGSPIYYGVRYKWNFGDGTLGTEQEVMHTYEHPGSYVVGVTVTFNDKETSTHITVKVLASGITLTTPGDGSIAVLNQTGEELDISGWMLTDLHRVFTIPQGTRLAKGGEARFAPTVTGIVGSEQARLLFPNGTVAASVQVLEVEKPKITAKVSQARAPGVVAAPLLSNESPQLAAAAATPAAPLTSTMLPWAALGGVLVAGMAGAYYSGRRTTGTKSVTDEFDIE